MFFKEDGMYVWNESPKLSAKERWPRDLVFPLTRRPFDGLWLPAPCDTAAVLSNNYDIALCVTRSYSHVYDFSIKRYRKPSVVPCDQLAELYPLVERTPVDKITKNAAFHNENTNASNYVIETLMLGNKTIHSVVVPTGCTT